MENIPEMVENNAEIIENPTEINTIDSLKSKRKYTMSNAKLEQLKIARQRASQVRKERAIERKENLRKSKEPEVINVVEESKEEPEQPSVFAEEPNQEEPIQDSIVEEPVIHVPLKRTPTFTKNDNGIMILQF